MGGRLVRTLIAAAALAVVSLGVPPPSAVAQQTTAARAGNVLETRVLGKSVRGRPITAWHLDDRPADGRTGPTVVLIATMHGNEGAPRKILQSLRAARVIHGVDLWLVPVYNPDGFAHHTRKNAHGVDPNRNYPYKWVPLDGNYESGSKPASERETRAMMRFLTKVKPAYVLSFHQPLHAVDVTERPTFSKRVARALDLPMSRLTCGSTCHGTMTMWFNHKFPGFALTVEYGAHPLPARLRTAPDKILRLFGAWRGGVNGVPRS
jgi:protein MpaA